MTPREHGVIVVAVLFFAIALLFLLACVAAAAAQASRRRGEIRLHREQVELARRAHLRAEAELRRSAVVSAPVLPRPTVNARPKRRAA